MKAFITIGLITASLAVCSIADVNAQTQPVSEQKATPLTPKELQERLDLLKFGPTKPMPDPIDDVLLEYAEGGQVAIISFNRPEANHAMTNQMGARLGELIEKVSVQSQVRCVIVTATGENFSGGTDLLNAARFQMNSGECSGSRSIG